MAQPDGIDANARVASPYGPDDEVESLQPDMVDQLLENYNFTCHPEVRIKFKQQLRQYMLGIAVAKPWHNRTRVRLTAKPVLEGSRLSSVVQKLLVVPTHSQVCLFSRKLQWRWLRLQFMAGYNWARMKPTLDYRLSTKWNDGGSIKHKERYQVMDNLLLRCKWNMNLHLPDMEGHLGADDLDLEPVDLDIGHLDFDICQVDLVVHSPWGRPPAPPPRPLLGPRRRPLLPGSPAPHPRPTPRQSEQSDILQLEQASCSGAAPAGSSGAGYAAGTGAASCLPAAEKEPGWVGAGGGPKPSDANQGSNSEASGSAGQLHAGMPDWLMSFLSGLSIKPATAHQAVR
ncbi:hypothetical protein V8C86DRAFT_2480865 [Haematococcus lacustris]